MRHGVGTALAAVLALTLLSPGVSLASVGLLSRLNGVSATRGYIGGLLHDESNSTQLLGEVTNEASVSEGSSGSRDDRVAIALTSTVVEQADGFTTSLDLLAVDYLIKTSDASVTLHANLEVTFRVETAADYTLSFDESRDDLFIDFSVVWLEEAGAMGNGPTEFVLGDFFSAYSPTYASPLTGRLEPGDYTFGFGAFEMRLNSSISDNLPPPSLFYSGQTMNAIQFTVTMVPEPNAALLVLLSCLACATAQRKPRVAPTVVSERLTT